MRWFAGTASDAKSVQPGGSAILCCFRSCIILLSGAIRFDRTGLELRAKFSGSGVTVPYRNGLLEAMHRVAQHRANRSGPVCEQKLFGSLPKAKPKPKLYRNTLTSFKFYRSGEEMNRNDRALQ